MPLTTASFLTSTSSAFYPGAAKFLWHPGLYHYGHNLTLPDGDGTYDLKVRIAAPTFPRHDKKNGMRYSEPVEVAFENIRMTTGRE